MCLLTEIQSPMSVDTQTIQYGNASFYLTVNAFLRTKNGFNNVSTQSLCLCNSVGSIQPEHIAIRVIPTWYLAHPSWSQFLRSDSQVFHESDISALGIPPHLFFCLLRYSRSKPFYLPIVNLQLKKVDQIKSGCASIEPAYKTLGSSLLVSLSLIRFVPRNSEAPTY